MNTNKQGRTAVYENSVKVAIAREYLTSNLSYGALGLKYGLPGADTVRHFVKWYKRNYPDTGEPGKASSDNNSIPVNNTGQLSKELKEANLKIAGLEMLIEIAQKELGIDIVKKSGTKQSAR